MNEREPTNEELERELERLRTKKAAATGVASANEREPTNEELERALERLRTKKAATTGVASARAPEIATENTWDKAKKLAGRAREEYANSLKNDTKRLKNTAGAIKSGVASLKDSGSTSLKIGAEKVQSGTKKLKERAANSVKNDTKRLKNTTGAIRGGVGGLKEYLTLSPEDRSTWLAHTRAGLGVRLEDNAMSRDREEMGDAEQGLTNLSEEAKMSWGEKNIPTLLAGLERIRNIKIGRRKNETEPDKEEMGDLVTEQDIQKAVEQLPPEDQKSIMEGLLGLGFKVEKLKNNVLASATGFFAQTNLNQDKYTTRFMKELSDSFKRDAKNADKRARDMAKGEGNWKTNLMSPALLAGNIYKYGRLITDITGKTASMPFRYVTMIGMGVSRLSEAGKEAHLRTEAVSEKTRIKNSEEAANVAWRVYEKTIATIGGEVSGEELQNIYVNKLPQDLLRRLQQPATASNFIQKFVKWDIKKAVERLDKNIKKIEQNKKYTTEQKEKKKLELLNGIQWKNALRDYDRMITEFGTVDEIATSAIYMKAVGRGLVGGALAGAIEVSLPKIWENISHAISQPGTLTGEIEPNIPSPQSDTSGIAQDLGLKPASSEVASDSVKVSDVQTDSTGGTVPETAAQEAAEAAATTAPEIISAGHEITTNFSIKLGEGEVPKNLETVFNAIAANHMDVPKERITAEFATKSLNMAANLVKLSEGHNVLGISAEEFKTIASFENGVLEIKDYGKFNEILTRLEENADQKWTDGVLQGKGAAITHIPNISEDGWLKIVRADGLDTTPDGIETGIVGHDTVTLEQITDFNESPMVKEAMPPTPTPVDNQAAIDSILEQIRTQMDKGAPSPVVEGATPEAPVAESMPTVSADNPFNLSPEMLQQVDQVYNDSIAKMFPRGWEQVWENVRNNPAERLLMVREQTIAVGGNEDYYTNFPPFVHKLYEMTGRLRPISETLLRSAETNEEYIKRALQKVAQMGQLDRIKI